MRIGIFLIAAQFPGQAAGQALAQVVEWIEAAEEAGFDDVWIAEHHFMSYGVCPSATTLAALALGRTRRIGVGTAVSVLSAWHPVALAEQAAMLHHLSGGRFTLGVGRGGPWLELEVLGTGVERYERGFAESLDVLCAAMSGERVAADGEFFRFREVEMVPAARMRPVVACTSRATLALAAERGLPMLLGMHVGDEEKAALLREHAALSGGVGGHVAAAVGFVGDSTERAVRELREAMPRWLEPGLAGYVPVDGRARPPRDIPKYVDFLSRTHPVGDPDLCVERIRRTAEVTGLRHLVLMVEGGGPDRTLDNIRRLGREVLPRARRPTPPGPVPPASSPPAPASG
ncbi:LLM class flavin-dependent oxidoreductase [Nonomuraea endophytica]|uniref:Alkanesulfonate monooxygenase SsuD/methylene tetrahydromethanopterin reductase-like flavin-dependent oxidoreductase (Luciferase family) n=1 Tax=Nonomuraea endophytica TaxID=714136 RepID=A0A7W8EE08_9ACTN|nr:LLM class flavin-dependent oxidoreductase [Nonomuraea endophytica]MBB5076104.1 alkanesulfonate monooxygenase SsuD/methylene tetrahydromethanopterin reductase-like flavin-dependent oxidoreductase (luciferase family) [Nonomuraea endophytica]